ncbi:conserved hypothetical membrane protein [Thermoplasma acidophilum]|uniref:Conserved hypothetical membrane protein n=1 Tax=Thermoplasma acidophilum (strain ATCC 25905 / DSM 1728 / JCM 9062 / NBRC 15155 / AMRC-C165) TaxID=273075 RepID=Q9HLP4_THEAC|nr:hypothetical protein [Thermoplasma acidophilum]CAC11329.1 conserved hypothetical membrane protein [Thermoplasma acidophilum]
MGTPHTINRREATIAIGIGVLFMIIALIVQEIAQDIPVFLFLIKDHFSTSGIVGELSVFELKNSILYSLYIGLAAGFIQEGFTFLAVDTRARNMAFFIGLGFSIVDIVILFFETFVVPVIEIHRSLILTPFEGLLVSLNIVSSVLFHPGTATFMKWGQIRGFARITYIISAFLHTAIDGGVVYTDLYVIMNRSTYITASAIFWTVAMSISVIIFIVGLTKLSSVSDADEFRVEKPVVF